MLANNNANRLDNSKSDIHIVQGNHINDVIVPRYMADVTTDEINRQAKTIFENINANRDALENKWSHDLSASRTDLLYNNNTSPSVFFTNILSYIESCEIHPIFKYISKKILEVTKLEDVCDFGLKPSYLNLNINGIPVSDLKIAKQLMQLVDFLISKLLKLSNFSDLIKRIPDIHEFTDDALNILKEIGFPPNVNIKTIPISVIVVLIKWFSKTDLQMSAVVKSIESTFLGGDIDEEWKNKSSISGEELVLSFYDHVIEWKFFFENRPDILPVISWGRYALQKIQANERYPFVQCFVKELNDCIAQNRLFNPECLIDVAEKSNINLQADKSIPKSIANLSDKSDYIKNSLVEKCYVVPPKKDRTFQLSTTTDSVIEKKRTITEDQLSTTPPKKRVKIASHISTDEDSNIRHSPPQKITSKEITNTVPRKSYTKHDSPPPSNSNAMAFPRNVFRNYEFLPRGSNIHFENPSNRTLPPYLVWCSYCGLGHYPGEHVFVDGVLQQDVVGKKFHIYKLYDTLLRKTGKYPTHGDLSRKYSQ